MLITTQSELYLEIWFYWNPSKCIFYIVEMQVHKIDSNSKNEITKIESIIHNVFRQL